MESRIIFHIDFDYFYAQCEEIRLPKLKVKPVCVCVFSDKETERGAIATANYIARKYKVKSGMPIATAKKYLAERSDAVFLPVDFDFYSELSEKAMRIMEKNADIFEYVGRDEAYLDVTKQTEENFETASHLAQQIKNTIKKELKLSCSIGISPNKLISKMASDFQKPDGLTVVHPDKIDEFLEPLNIRTIPGIGEKTSSRLQEMKRETIRDLKKLDIFTLNKEFGRKNGTWMYNAAKGIDYQPVKLRKASIQYSKITTLKNESKDYQFLSESVIELCNQVHDIVTKKNQMFRSVGVQFIQSDLTSKSKSRMLRAPTSSIEELQKNADQLLKQVLEKQTTTFRRIGVKVSELTEIQGQSEITAYF